MEIQTDKYSFSSYKISTKDGSGFIQYGVAGTGFPVLSLPSLGDTRHQNKYLVQGLLAGGYKVITTDLRGMGQSSGKFKSYSLVALADDIKSILDNEKIEKVVLVGNSISGASASLFALQNPDMVKALVLVNPMVRTGSLFMRLFLAGFLSIPGVGSNIWTTYFKSLFPSRPLDQDYLSELKSEVKKPYRMRSIVRMSYTSRLDDRMSELNVPALIFVGEKDPDYKDAAKEAAWLKQKIPASDVKFLEGLGHLPQYEKPETVNPVILNWLRQTVL
jgi:pimeloyl-ACP methyl ester carboxylesterase